MRNRAAGQRTERAIGLPRNGWNAQTTTLLRYQKRIQAAWKQAKCATDVV
jgi:hypothetical protein